MLPAVGDKSDEACGGVIDGGPMGSAQDAGAASAGRRLGRVLCVYENQPISVDSTRAVPRLLAQLCQHFADGQLPVELTTLSPGGGDVRGATNLAAELPALQRIAVWVRSQSAVKWVCGKPTLEAAAPARRMRSGLRAFAAHQGEGLLLISATMTSVLVGRETLPKSRIVYWIQGMPRLGQEPLASRAIDAADLIVAPSQALYRDFFQLVCRDRFAPPVRVIPNCIDREQFPTLAPEQLPAVRRRLGISDQEVAIAHIGRAPEKGLQVIEAALPHCQFNARPIVVVSAGGSKPERRQVTSQTSILEIGRVPPQSVNEMYQACQLGVIPSVWWENCPLALIEMMSLGMCVIGSRVGGIPEILEHRENGLVVDAPNDLIAWAQALDSVLAEPALRQRLGENARRTVEHRFSQSRVMTQWEAVLRNAVGD